jgi:hypothetical protein
MEAEPRNPMASGSVRSGVNFGQTIHQVSMACRRFHLLECFFMRRSFGCSAAKFSRISLLLTLSVCASPLMLQAQSTPAVPDWALPGSATHKQVPPPADFHRPSRIENKPIGIFDGQADVGSALVPGSASYDEASKQYTVHSAGYNIWYQRDEFHFLYKKMSGDVSLAADTNFPDPNGYNDRKVVLIIRQTLEDDSKEAMLGMHGTGMIHLAERPEKGSQMSDMQFRFGGTMNGVMAQRIGIEKKGDQVAIFVSLKGEPLHQFGPPVTLHFDGPFYVGIGFCSHLPATVDTGVFSKVVLENEAGKVE